MRITPADPSDIASIVEIRAAAFSYYAPQAYTAIQVETLLSDYKLSEFETMIDARQLFVCKIDDTRVGRVDG